MRPPRRLLLITPDFPPATGGIQLLLGEVVGRLRTWEITVMCRAAPIGRHGVAPRGAIRILRGRLRRRRPSLIELNIRAATRAILVRPDVILCGHVHLAPAALAAKFLTRRPLVTYLYADEIVGHRRWTHALLARSERVIAISRYTADIAREGGAASASVRLIPPGAGPVRATPTAPGGRPPSVVTVARLTDRYKGHDLMIDAIRTARLSVPNLHWDVVGDGPLRDELMKKSAAAGLSDAITFHGRVSDGERDALLSAADVFAMPSRLPPSGVGGEGFGIVYLEAALHGVPSVAGRSAGVADAVVHEETGLLVDPESSDAIARGLVRIVSDRAFRDRLGEAARMRAERDFNWDQIAGLVDAVLHEAAATRHESR